MNVGAESKREVEERVSGVFLVAHSQSTLVFVFCCFFCWFEQSRRQPIPNTIGLKQKQFKRRVFRNGDLQNDFLVT